MTADHLAVALIVIAAPAATMFPFVYAFRPWHTTLIGRALMVQSVGLMLLIDISLAYKAFGDDYALRDAVRLTVYALITLGTWGVFVALVRTPRAP